MSQARYRKDGMRRASDGPREYYESQSPEEAIAEDEAAYESTTHTMMGFRGSSCKSARDLIARRRTG